MGQSFILNKDQTDWEDQKSNDNEIKQSKSESSKVCATVTILNFARIVYVYRINNKSKDFKHDSKKSYQACPFEEWGPGKTKS